MSSNTWVDFCKFPFADSRHHLNLKFSRNSRRLEMKLTSRVFGVERANEPRLKFCPRSFCFLHWFFNTTGVNTFLWVLTKHRWGRTEHIATWELKVVWWKLCGDVGRRFGVCFLTQKLPLNKRNTLWTAIFEVWYSRHAQMLFTYACFSYVKTRMGAEQ